MRSEKEKAKQGVAYDVRHSLVEKRVVGKVLMEKEMQAIESSKKTLLEKPAVARVKIEKIISDKGRDKFYGPNLPVIWGEDLIVNTQKKGSRLGVGTGTGVGNRGHGGNRGNRGNRGNGGDGDSGSDEEEEDSSIEDVSKRYYLDFSI